MIYIYILRNIDIKWWLRKLLTINSQSKYLLNCLNTTTDTALKSVTSSIIIFEKKKKNHISCAECSNQQYSKLLACGCIIGAELSHWHGSNLCLQALKSAVTGWNNNYVLITHWSFQWITARGDSSVSQEKPTARVKSDIRRIASIDSQCRNVSLNKNLPTPQTMECKNKVWSKLTCPQPGALHTKGRSSPIFAKSLQCSCGRGAEENIVVASPQFVNW